ERVVGVLRVNRNAADEAAGLRWCIDARERYAGRRGSSVGGNEEPAEARRRPKGAGVARRSDDRYYIAAALIRTIGCARQSSAAQRYPIAAGRFEVAGLFIAVLVKVSLRSAAIDRTPDVLKADIHCATDAGITYKGNIERCGFVACSERVSD